MSESQIAALYPLAGSLQNDAGSSAFWDALTSCVSVLFGQRLLTALVYDAQRQVLARVFSNRPDINPVGGIKRVTPSRWSEHVLSQGQMLVGSTQQDIEAFFSEHALLHANGCDSVLNIPVRKSGVTIGTLNLLDAEHHYDHADLRLACLVAQLCVQPLSDALIAARTLPVPALTERV